MTGSAKTYIGKPCKHGHVARYVRNDDCAECHRSYVAAWVRANPQRHRVSHSAWSRANAEMARSHGAKYRAANREKEYARNAAWRGANRANVRARSAEWQKANPAACSASKARRKARKLAAPGRGVTAAQWREVLAESLGLCAYCNERYPLSMDHIEPLSKGGAHDVDNIVAACSSCNSSKGDRPLLVWLALRSLARAA